MNKNYIIQNTVDVLSKNKGLVSYFEVKSSLNLELFVTKIFNSSPYLARSLEEDGNWISSAFTGSFESMVDELIQQSEGLLEEKNLETIFRNLRLLKRRVSLIIAIADINGIWSLKKVTSKLTKFADSSLSLAFDAITWDHANIKKPDVFNKKFKLIKEIKSSDVGLIIIAMGKMGAFELNYSSDIDFNVFFKSELYSYEELLIFRPILISITKDVIRFLSEHKGYGYVFRTDLRLRPEPSINPVCLSTKFALEYYKKKGRTWERSAYIKARSVAGNIHEGKKFLRNMQPFIWRKKLNYFAIQDTQDIRKKIALKTRSITTESFLGFDVKVGSGGIRDIELFTQTLQLIYGGKASGIRCAETCQSLEMLQLEGWITDKTKKHLISAYEFYRNLEHKIQMVNDTQTHKLPKTKTGLIAIAELMLLSSEELESSLRKNQEVVISICDQFFSGINKKKTTALSKINVNSEILNQWSSFSKIREKWKKYNIFRSQRAFDLFLKIEKKFQFFLQQTPFPQETLINIDKYFSQLSSGVEIFSLFNANKIFIRIFIDAAAKAPIVLENIGQNTDILASVMQKGFYDPIPKLLDLVCIMENILGKEDSDYEEKLNLIRQFTKELKFRVTIQLVQGKLSIEDASRFFSIVAEAVLHALTPIVTENFSKRYGHLSGKGIAIIAMGKLGSKEMTFTSDLDLIIVYDPASLVLNDVKSNFHPSTYFSKLTKELVSALTATMNDGYLYNVDMRLRPSGSKGPVAVSYSSFSNYHTKEAWTWEHLAMIRGRVVYGDHIFSQKVQNVITTALNMPRDLHTILYDVDVMRSKLLENTKIDKKKIRSLNLKAGQGMMQDLELLVKMGALITRQGNGENIIELINRLEKADFLSNKEAKILMEAWKLFYYSDFLSRYFYFEIPSTMGLETHSWADIFQKNQFFSLLMDNLPYYDLQKKARLTLENKVIALSIEVSSIFTRKILN